MKEAMRLHPGVGFPLERFVPDGGDTICGQYLPAGAIVSISAPVVHNNKEVWGDDADEFRPERWIDSDAEQLKLMDRSFLAVSSLHHFFASSTTARHFADVDFPP